MKLCIKCGIESSDYYSHQGPSTSVYSQVLLRAWARSLVEALGERQAGPCDLLARDRYLLSLQRRSYSWRSVRLPDAFDTVVKGEC
jgi:hypothetical protein